MSCLASSTTIAVISLVSEAIETTRSAFFSSSTLPVPSSMTSTDCDPNGTARAAAETDISTLARIFLIIVVIVLREK